MIGIIDKCCKCGLPITVGIDIGINKKICIECSIKEESEKNEVDIFDSPLGESDK